MQGRRTEGAREERRDRWVGDFPGPDRADRRRGDGGGSSRGLFDGRESRGRGRRSEGDRGALEQFNRDVAADVNGELEVHPAMSERWTRFCQGLSVLLESNEELEWSREEAQERTEMWVMAAVHRLFAGPLSAIMSHEEGATGIEKKRYAEMTDVLHSVFKSEVTKLPPLPATPEDLARGPAQPVPRADILKAAQTTKCFRCGARDNNGRHFAGVCGASFDTQHNSLHFKGRTPTASGARQGVAFGAPEVGTGGMRGSRVEEQQSFSREDVEEMVSRAIREQGEGRHDADAGRRGRRRSPASPARFRSREAPRAQLPGPPRTQRRA